MKIKATVNSPKISQVFNASPVNAIDSIVITSESDTGVVLAEWHEFDPGITVHSDLSSTQAVRLFVNWSDKNGTLDLQPDDFFTFVIPDIFIYDYITNVTDIDIKDADGLVVATYSIYDNSNGMKEVRVNFTDYVETHSNIYGNFWAVLFVASVDSSQVKDIEFIINDSIVAQGDVTVNPDTGTIIIPENSKNGFSSPTEMVDDYYIFEWLVYINMDENIANGFNTLGNFSFEDIIPADSPHVFLTDDMRQSLGISPDDYMPEIGEYKGADFFPPDSRYQMFNYHYNSVGANIWYNFIDWNILANGLSSDSIEGGSGLNVTNVQVTDKSFSANLGTLTRPTAIRFHTVATVKMTESALGDPQVVGLFTDVFIGSYGENLNSQLTLYRFEAGGTAQGIDGDYDFTFFKVDNGDNALMGAMFSLFTSTDFEAGADRFVYSAADGSVTFTNLPLGTYYFLETMTPEGYLPNTTVYMVVINSSGYEIYYGENFENRLSDVDNRIRNISEFEILPVSVALTGMKNLTGENLATGMFRFVVKDDDDYTVATGINSANGIIYFSDITFYEPGIYSFTVEEVMSGHSGIIYDGSKFTVTITVTIGESGSLTANIAYPDGDIVFNNEYVAPPEPPINPPVKPTVMPTVRPLEPYPCHTITRATNHGCAMTPLKLCSHCPQIIRCVKKIHLQD